MHLLAFTRLSDDEKIARRIESGELSVYDFTHGGAVWARDEDDPAEPDKFYDPVRRTGTSG